MPNPELIQSILNHIDQWVWYHNVLGPLVSNCKELFLLVLIALTVRSVVAMYYSFERDKDAADRKEREESNKRNEAYREAQLRASEKGQKTDL